jgi:hypothetical protein
VTEAEQSLLQHFQAWELPQNATAWLMDLWGITQFLDDIVDGDLVRPQAAHDAVWKILVTFPGNPFFVANASALQTALATAILKWEASHTAERTNLADERSFMWRAAYYDIVMLVVLLCQGYESAMAKAPSVMALYGEKFSDYRAEFPNA